MLLLRAFGMALILLSGFVGIGLYASGTFETKHEGHAIKYVGTGKDRHLLCVPFEYAKPNLTPAIPVAAGGLVGILCTLLSFLQVGRVRNVPLS